VNTSTNRAAGAVFNIGSGGGTFDVASGSAFVLDDGTGSGNLFTNAQLQGNGKLTKIGDGTLYLGNGSASNAVFTGQILINEGVLKLGFAFADGVALGSTAAGTTIAAGAGFDINNNAGTAAEPLTISGATSFSPATPLAAVSPAPLLSRRPVPSDPRRPVPSP
jgi:autotransporter-associated beta strand protein